MSNYRYILEKGSKKYNCPNCGKKRFVRFIDIEMNKEHLPIEYGRCDRESKCGYNLSPYNDGYSKMIREQEQGIKTDWQPQRPIKRKPKPKAKLVPFPIEILKRSLGGYEQNKFIQNLLLNVPFPFETKDVEKVISHYHLGTIQKGYRTGAITFPFIDKGNIVRTIQVKEFDENNNTTGTDFLHSIIEKNYTHKNKPVPEWLKTYNENEIKVSCLFGEHLLNKYPNNPIALVEAPKTAIYGTLYFGFPKSPKDLLWLAVFNLSSLNLERCKPLQGRNVLLFPDLSKGGEAFKLWSDKAEVIQKQLQGTQFNVSDLLEQLAPKQDKEKGKDIADYLIKQDWRAFRKEVEEPQPQVEPVPSFKEAIEPTKSNNWDEEIEGLEAYFNNAELPTKPIRADQCSIVYNARKFIDGHLQMVKNNNGNKTHLPYLHRLQEFKEIILTNKKIV